MNKLRIDSHRRRLSQALTNRQAGLVFGSGITVQATKGAKTSSWVGLLESGIEHCVSFANFSDDEAQKWAEARRADLRNPDPKSYVKVAGEIERALKGLKNERRQWLEDAIGGLEVRDPKILNAIQSLAARFSPKILTTNYDTILAQALHVNDITWEDDDAARNVLNGSSRNVLHIHGLWSRADTVVLGTDSYAQLLQNKAAQILQQAFTALNSLIFVGCGDGIKDDNIGALLRWFETALPDNSQRHYILLRDDEVQKFPSTRWLLPISYGSSYHELLGFLDSLRPMGSGFLDSSKPVMDKEAMERQVKSAKGLIDRLAEAWAERNHGFQGETSLPPKSVGGSWKGQQTQQTGPADEPITYPVALHLDIANDIVSGTFSFRFGPEGLPLVDESLKLKGRLDHGRFLRLSYEGSDGDKSQFGTLLLEMTADGDTLIGNDIGYGYTSRQTLTALTRLRRSESL